jgi:hypothetical protein
MSKRADTKVANNIIKVTFIYTLVTPETDYSPIVGEATARETGLDFCGLHLLTLAQVTSALSFDSLLIQIWG